MIECNDLFDYGYKIYQNSNYFKFSLDSILLAEFVKLKNGFKVLDMCTGNAPIPMILLTKNNNITIDAVEIQKEIYDLANSSIKINQLHDKVTIYNENVKTINLTKKYDVITCNPPYFKVDQNSLLNENTIKRIARHEVTINLEEVVKTAAKYIKETGTFYLVHRIDRLLEAIDSLKNYNFGLRRLCFIYTKKNSKAEFFLIEASKYKKSDLKIYSYNISNLKSYKGIFEE